MQTPLQITVKDMPHSEALDSHIREKAQKLQHFYEHLLDCRVVVCIPHKHKHQGKTFNVRIDMVVPGCELVVNHDSSEEVFVALRDAFDAAIRRLEEYAQKQAWRRKASLQT